VSAWHVRAVVLPGGEAPVDLWVERGGRVRYAARRARSLPGAFVLLAWREDLGALASPVAVHLG
jgi:hypothetical protein